jgi:hypothetical protein
MKQECQGETTAEWAIRISATAEKANTYEQCGKRVYAYTTRSRLFSVKGNAVPVDLTEAL